MKSAPFIRSFPQTCRFTVPWLAGSAALLFFAEPLRAEVPHAIAHQGRIVVTGVNFEGDGQFKFLLFADADADHVSGNETPVWSNDSTTPAAMTEPASAVTVAVTKGLYGTWLGDTSIPNMAALPASVEPGTGERLYLRIWFNDGSNGFQALTPDQTIAAVPFALSAAGVTAGGVTAAALADGAVTSQKMAAGAVTGAVLEDGAVTAAKLADDAVTGDKIATGAVTSIGMPAGPQSMAPAPMVSELGSHSTSLVDGRDIAVQGNFAYVVDGGAGKLQIFEVSNPKSISVRDADQTGLSSPRSVAVQGNYAYVVDSGTGRLQIFDVSNPGLIVAKGFAQGLSNPRFVEVEGSFAYVGDATTQKLHIFDVSDPENIVPLGTSAQAGGVGSMAGIGVADGLAYVLEKAVFEPFTGRLHAFNVSNPNSVTSIGSRLFDEFVLRSQQVTSLKVQGRTVYVAGQFADRIFVFNFPANPTFVPGPSVRTIGFAPISVDLDGSVIVAFGSGGSGSELRLSNPDGFFSSGGDIQSSPLATDASMTVANGYAYVVDGPTLQIFQTSTLAASTSLGVNGPLKVKGPIEGQAIKVNGPIEGQVIEAQTVQVDSVVSEVFSFPGPKPFAHMVPGNSMQPQTNGENFFRSTIGFIQSSTSGADPQLNAVAPVHLPEGAKVTGMDLMYYDNSVAQSFTNFTTRFRRENIFSTNPASQNLIALDVPSPASPNSTVMQRATSNSVAPGLEVIDNMNHLYWVSVDFTCSAPDSGLRFYGFRIRYTLDTLAP